MLDWFLTHFEQIVGIVAAVSLIGIVLGFLHITLKRPSRLRWRVLGGIALLGLVWFFVTLRGGPGARRPLRKNSTLSDLIPYRPQWKGCTSRGKPLTIRVGL